MLTRSSKKRSIEEDGQIKVDQQMMEVEIPRKRSKGEIKLEIPRPILSLIHPDELMDEPLKEQITQLQESSQGSDDGTPMYLYLNNLEIPIYRKFLLDLLAKATEEEDKEGYKEDIAFIDKGDSKAALEGLLKRLEEEEAYQNELYREPRPRNEGGAKKSRRKANKKSKKSRKSKKFGKSKKSKKSKKSRKH
jgi:hypothetical protein